MISPPGVFPLPGSICADPGMILVEGVGPSRRPCRSGMRREGGYRGDRRASSGGGGRRDPGGAAVARAVPDPVPGVVQRQRLEADRDLPGHRRGGDSGGRAGAYGDRADRPDDPADADLAAGGCAGRPVQQAVDHRRHEGLRAGPDASGRGGALRPAPRRAFDARASSGFWAFRPPCSGRRSMGSFPSWSPTSNSREPTACWRWARTWRS